MKLRQITPTTFKAIYHEPAYIKRTVDQEMIKSIVESFMRMEDFIAEVTLDEEDRIILKDIIKAFREYIKLHHIKAGVIIRQDRIFLRNDAVPLCVALNYPAPIVNGSKKNRMNF